MTAPNLHAPATERSRRNPAHLPPIWWSGSGLETQHCDKYASVRFQPSTYHVYENSREIHEAFCIRIQIHVFRGTAWLPSRRQCFVRER